MWIWTRDTCDMLSCIEAAQLAVDFIILRLAPSIQFPSLSRGRGAARVRSARRGVFKLHLLARRRRRRCLRRSSLGPNAAARARARSRASARSSCRRDDIEGETEALSLDVVRPRRSLRRGVVSKVCPLAPRGLHSFTSQLNLSVF